MYIFFLIWRRFKGVNCKSEKSKRDKHSKGRLVVDTYQLLSNNQ